MIFRLRNLFTSSYLYGIVSLYLWECPCSVGDTTTDCNIILGLEVSLLYADVREKFRRTRGSERSSMDMSDRIFVRLALRTTIGNYVPKAIEYRLIWVRAVRWLVHLTSPGHESKPSSLVEWIHCGSVYTDSWQDPCFDRVHPCGETDTRPVTGVNSFDIRVKLRLQVRRYGSLHSVTSPIDGSDFHHQLTRIRTIGPTINPYWNNSPHQQRVVGRYAPPPVKIETIRPINNAHWDDTSHYQSRMRRFSPLPVKVETILPITNTYCDDTPYYPSGLRRSSPSPTRIGKYALLPGLIRSTPTPAHWDVTLDMPPILSFSIIANKW